MTTRIPTSVRVTLVAVAAFGGYSGAAEAQLTPAGTAISNRATVNYSVGGAPQTPIESSPTGNTTPGVNAGANTTFVVDNRVDLTVAEISGNATLTAPGAANAVLAFTVTNAGNAPQGYALSFAEEVATTLFGRTDSANFGNLVIRVDEDPSGGDGTGNGLYDGTETAAAVDVLNPGRSITVFIVSPTVPLTLLNLDVANVRLEARAAVPGTNGSTLETESTGANDPTAVEVVFADAGNDATESAVGQYLVQSAALTVTKSQAVLDDGFGNASPRAIPGAVVEYTITVTNTSATTPADAVAISDPVPANTTLRLGQYAGEDVGVTGGAATTCTADAADADSDGCGVTAGTLTVGAAAIGNIAAGGAVTVRFQVTID